MPVVPRPAARSSAAPWRGPLHEPRGRRPHHHSPARRTANRTGSRLAGCRSRCGLPADADDCGDDADDRGRDGDGDLEADLGHELDADDGRAFGHHRRPEPRADPRGGHPARRIRGHQDDRRRRLRHRLSRLGPFARPQGRAQGIHADLAGLSCRRHRHQAALRAAPGNLRGRPQELHQRSQDAGAVRASLAAQGLPLLGGERHRLHGDALPRRLDRARHRPGDARARRTRPGSSACWRRCSTRWWCCIRRRSTTATSPRTTCC